MGGLLAREFGMFEGVDADALPAEATDDVRARGVSVADAERDSAVAARRVAIPWGHDVMQELFEGRLEEEVAERKTAAQVLGSALQSAKLEQVPNFDFVSPRAVMEECVELF